MFGNNISLNVAKTELIIFRKTNTEIPEMKIMINGKNIYPSKSTKYLGIHLDDDLSGVTHCNELLPKLRRANGMLSKARHFITNKKDLLSIYYSMFSSILTYASQVWGLLDSSALNKVESAQKAALRIISFSDFRAHTAPICQELKLLRLNEFIKLQNILLIHDFRNNNLPASFSDYFDKENLSWAETRAESQALTKVAFASNYNQIKYGRKSITHTSINIWNRFAKHVFPNLDMTALSRNKMKAIVTDHFLKTYTDLDS